MEQRQQMECQIEHNPDELVEVLEESENRILNSPCTCCECGETIQPRTLHKYTRFLYDYREYEQCVCLDCVSITDAFFKDCYAPGRVLEMVRDKIWDLGGEVDSSCILPLTEKAKDRVFGYIQEVIDG